MHRAILRIVTLAAVAMIPSTVAFAARADEPTPSDETSRTTASAKLAEEGMALYGTHDYRAAIDKFVQAYAVDPDPNLLFNIARSYELLNDVDTAIDKYELFLSKPGGDPKGRQRAQASLASLHEIKAVRDSQSSLGPTQRRTQQAVRHAAQGRSEAKPPWAVLGWISLGVGVSAGAAGTAVYVSGVADHDQVTGSKGFGQPGQVAGITQVRAQDLVDRGNEKKTMGGVLWGVGGAGVVAAAVFFLAGKGGNKEGVSVAFAPAAHGGSMAVRGTF
jgi:hypothetical protein